MGTEGKNILYIFNGDCAFEAWQKSVDAEGKNFLVWRENYLEGPLPANVPLEEFEKTRAALIHTWVPEYSCERLYNYLLSMDKKLLSLTEKDIVVLYFDCCMYDIVMLCRIFSLLRGGKAEVRLFCEDTVLGREEEVYKRDIASLRKRAPETGSLYASAWDAILQGAQAVEKFNLSGMAEKEKFLAEGLRRYGEDHPVGAAMGKSEKILCSLVENGICSFREIFHSFLAQEKYPFMGDTMCLRLLDSLAERKFLRKEGTGMESFYFCNTPDRGSVHREKEENDKKIKKNQKKSCKKEKRG